MITLRQIVPALCLATALSGVAVHAATTDAPATNSAQPSGHGHWRGGRGGMGGMMFVLHKLNLTPEQKAQVKTLFADQKSQFEALHASARTNRQALETTPPTDSSGDSSSAYAALLETAKANAAQRITLESQMWSEIYQHVLTQTQKQSIPGIVAAAQAARQAKMAAWKAEHSQTAN
jgi:Spy/CpxP family protein refolding chaperone